MRLVWVHLALIYLTLTTQAVTQDIAALYQAQAIVTGTGEENRQIGFRLCLAQVVVKVSGDQQLLTRSGFVEAEAHAGDFVAQFRYRDRMEGIPVHDEQGTHDRPHDLTCIYDPATLDPLLGSLGGKPWLESRPRLAVFLAVENAKSRFVLTGDGEDSPYMRDSFEAAAIPIAMEVTVASRATFDAGRLDFTDLAAAGMEQLDRLARQAGADQALAGSIVWSDAELGWVADWRLASGGRAYAWQVRGVSFDEAFRVAMRGAAQILSGNGSP